MQLKVGATLYPAPTRPLELGDQRLIKREFGFVPGKDEIDLQDPDHVAALVYMAMREANPDEPAARLVSRTNRVRQVDILGDDGEPITDESAEAAPAELDPTPAETENGGVSTT